MDEAVLADGSALPEGVDFVHLVDGRIARIAGFFGAEGGVSGRRGAGEGWM